LKKVTSSFQASSPVRSLNLLCRLGILSWLTGIRLWVVVSAGTALFGGGRKGDNRIYSRDAGSSEVDKR
jgi:hypothetical protein